MSCSSLDEFEKSEIESIKEDLINSVSTEFNSAPSSPVHTKTFLSVARSAPPSPISCRDSAPRSKSVQNIVAAIDSGNLATLSELKDFGNFKGYKDLKNFKGSQVQKPVKMGQMDEIKDCCTNLKRVISRFLNQLKKAETATTLDVNLLNLLKPKILTRIKDLESKEMELDSYLNKSKIAEDDPIRKYGEDLIKYISDSEIELARLCKFCDRPSEASNAQGVNPAELFKSVSQMGNGPIKISVDSPNFYGDERDRLEFKNWLAQFEAVINSCRNWTEESKVSYLKSKVLKNAAHFIAHINPAPGSYDLCMQALKDQYLDEEFIVDEHFKLLWTKSPEFDQTYTKTRVYIADVRNALHNLKTHYQIDLLDEDTGGHKFLSHIIFSKLSKELRQAFSWELRTDYPTFSKILGCYSKVINSVVRNRNPNHVSKYPSSKPGNLSKPWQNRNPNNSAPTNVQTPTLNFAVPEASKTAAAVTGKLADPSKPPAEPPVLHCRFCNVDGHTSLHCSNFPTYDIRIKKCNDMRLCNTCTSAKHDFSKCPGLQNKLYRPCKICNSRQHVAAMCSQRVPLKPTITNACLSTDIGHKSNYLLPVCSITMQSREGDRVSFNALFDTGSSRSYIDPKVANQLAISQDMVTHVQYEVRTFLGAGTKELGETTLLVYFPSGNYHALPIFIDDNFCVNLEVRGLRQVVTNLRALNTPLGAEFSDSSDKLEINGLIGSDILQYINFSTVKCMFGKALKVENKLIPFGNSEHFLHPGQVGNFDSSYRVESNYKTIISKVKCSDTIVNTCLDPKASYEDSLGPLFEDSSVERRIDRMVSCDSVGIEDVSEQSVSDFDKEKIAQFEKSIEIKDKIYVELVWGDNISEVPSNFSVSLAVLDRVSQKLERSGQLKAYNNVFFDQLEQGIIEEFSCDPEHFSDYIWLPHRPVFKTDEQVTTKIRPVFNCSLKTAPDKPSLNEASYQGVNNMQDMVMLLMLFRSNKYVLLGDLRQAFLQIHLKSVHDKNRFCFFLKDGNRLRCFRYNTLLFGYCCSPFILNHVIRHIAKLHPEDECSRMIASRFFVDNLVKTGNSVEELSQLYKESANRLDAVHFDLRSCNSNSPELVKQMKEDGRFIKHGQHLDKVLGYCYSPESDHLQLNSVKVDSNANSKRKILSESSKPFDPLGMTGPVSVRSKQLLSKLWKGEKSKNHWDETVNGEIQREWTNLSKDLQGLSTLKFPRLALLDDLPMDIFIFCDASKVSYGFVAYAVQQGKSEILFAKPKVAPIKGRSVPQLELLGAVLASQCLLTILETYKHVKIDNVYIHLDAQLVLSWLLSSTRPKNTYTCNRIKDVKKNVTHASETYNVKVSFKYVPTGDNPADMLSRGVSLTKFSDQLDFWLHGPDWIRGDTVQWPSSDYGCLSEASKNLVMCTDVGAKQKPQSPVVSFERYSSFLMLVNSVSNVFQFLKLKGVLKEDTLKRLWGTTDTLEIGKLHLIKIMQAEAFPQELAYLNGSRTIGIPARVRDMNLFLDSYGIIRSDGRMGKVDRFDYNLMYPILLAPKEHTFTKLLVTFYHKQVQHLGIRSTLTKVRLAGFRLIHSYQCVKSIIKPCFVCKRFNSLSFKYPRMTDLPSDRVNLVRPYTNVGVDHTGFIMVREGDKEEKYYLLIFTCLCTRAIHIELLPAQSVEQFVLALVRFCNIYGIPDAIYSDNAATFISGANVLKQVFTSDEFKSAFGTHNIKHNTIPLGAPWVGSIWERCIRTVKSCLRKTIGRVKLDYFRLITVLSDIQSAINQRPLTYRCSDDFGLEVICPNDFLHPYVENSLLIKNPKGILPPTKARRVLIESLEARDTLLENFKDIWYNEYLVGLRDSYKDLHDAKFNNQVKVGDIVLLKNIQPDVVKKRQHWSLARVLELHYGADKKVRSVKLLKGTEDYRTRPRQPEVHPINHLYPLELSITHQPCVVVPQSQEYEDLVNMEVDTDLDYSEDSVDYVEHNEPSGPFESILAPPEDNCPSPSPVVQTLSDNLDAPVSEEEQIQVEPVRYSGRGRKIIPRKGWEDFVPE